MKILFILLLTLTAQPLFAQTEISLKEVSKHIGKSVSIVGIVEDGKYISDKELTLLNIGAKFPNQLLTIVIKGDDRVKFKEAPEELFKGKQIIVSGKLEIYKGKPQIVVSDYEQIIVSFKG